MAGHYLAEASAANVAVKHPLLLTLAEMDRPIVEEVFSRPIVANRSSLGEVQERCEQHQHDQHGDQHVGDAAHDADSGS